VSNVATLRPEGVWRILYTLGLGENAEADTERNGTDMAERNGTERIWG
jgi:hypothetical protein